MKRAERNIFRAVATEYDVTIEQILSDSRLQHISEARHMTMLMLHKELGHTLIRIAGIFKRSHPTIIYAKEKMEYLIEKDKVARLHYTNICILLGINKSKPRAPEV